MRKTFLILLGVLFLLVANLKADLMLSWSYPSHPATNVLVTVYTSTNVALPFAQWDILCSVANPATNAVRVDSASPMRFFAVVATFYTVSHQVTPLTLWWNESPSSNIINYRIYTSPISGVFSNRVLVPKTNTATIAGISSLTFFAASALDGWGGESQLSNEIAFEPPTVTTTVAVMSLPLLLTTP